MNIEKYDATVTAVDEEQLGRIRVSCAGLLGDEDSELPDWVLPKFDWGWFYIPDVGEIVEIEVTTGSETDEIPGQSSIDGLDVHWTGTGKRYLTNESVEGQNEVRIIHDEFKTNYGKRRGFATPAGHIFVFDDTDGSEKIILSWKHDTSKQSVTFDNDGILVEDKHGNVIRMKDGSMETEGTQIDLKNGKINLLDGADEKVMRGDTTKTWLDTHTHPTGMGPSGPPTVALPSNALSQNCKVGP